MMTMEANIKTPRYLVSRWPSQAQVSASSNHINQYQKTGMEINKLVVDSRYAPKLFITIHGKHAIPPHSVTGFVDAIQADVVRASNLKI